MYSEVDVNHAPLPGYRLTERLGAGGYGEVWRAEAPGGLTKAIKFVFGQQHEKRASRELRSLELIKELRHPFLLSLERIEVVEGRLLIVTELAEGSVKDRFDACRKDNLPGIPRDELLRYLRDAADALDYMAEAHSLQHLDIKPENLLLLAGHVKVADFGLVKDMKQSEASLVGGMTPLYAAPEVFRGRPSRQSDQYALAIVYQEMLTGGLPFIGNSAAELTLQHLNDEPDLASLSGADRYVVSRALSKEPTHRYFTCREFVEALANVSAASGSFGASMDADVEPSSAAPNPWQTEIETHPSRPTELFDEEPAVVADASLLIELPETDRVARDLPPVAVDVSSFRPSPTLILGIGGGAGRVLFNLREQLSQQFGDRPLPAVQMLYIDTDPKALANVSPSDGRGLTVEETLSVPLRRPQHYRERWDQLLCWLSRRWLYNIPKSLRTEGLRPLGRLAFVDHARQTCQRIRRAMDQAVAQETLAVSSATAGREFRHDVARIYLVASVSGGTGSGMVLDVAYAVRAMLEKLALSRVTMIGIMLHATGRDPRHCELSRVNAYSWLTEFQHFHRQGSGYPGDASCGLPRHEPGVPAFDHTYLVHLGESLDSNEFDQATQSVAEYLRLDALSPVQDVLDACRHMPADSADRTAATTNVNLRSFGVHRREAAPSGFCDEAAAAIAARLLTDWRSLPNRTSRSSTASPSAGTTSGNSETNHDPPGASSLIRRLQLTPAGIASNARVLAEARLGSEVDRFLETWLASRLPGGETGGVRPFAAIDEVFAESRRAVGTDGSASILGQPLADVVAPLCEKLRSEIRRWVLRQLDDPRQRLAGAIDSLEWLRQYFQAFLVEVQQLRGDLAAKIANARAIATTASGGEGLHLGGSVAAGGPQHATQYFQLRLEQLAYGAVNHIGRLILSDTKSIGDDLTTFGRELAQMAAALRSDGGIAEAIEASAAPRQANDSAETRAITTIRARLEALSADVEARLHAEYLHELGGIYQTVMQGGRPRAQLCAKLQEFARQCVYQALAGLDVVSPSIDGAAGDGNHLRAALADATPSLLEFGGARRVLAILPQLDEPPVDCDTFSQAMGTTVWPVIGDGSGFALCVEAEQLSLAHSAVAIVQRRRDSVEFANRVHSRSDVDWMPLLAGPAVPQPRRNEKLTTLPLASDHALRQTEVV